MAYRPPQLQIYQDFQPTLQTGITPLYATMLAPWYALHRYSDADEQARIGDYDRDVVNQSYDWPDHVAGGVVDLLSARLVVENALLQYYRSFGSIHALALNGNQFLSGLIFHDNAAADATEIAFGTRGVAVGDIARLHWIDPGTMLQVDFESVVAGFVADIIAGTTNPVPRFATDFGSTTKAAVESVTHPAPTRLTVSYDPDFYAGLVDGYPSDVYTIRVMAVGYGIISGGTLDGTTLKITSAGNDTEVTVVFGAASAPWNGGSGAYDMNLGARGATMAIADVGSGSLAVGQLWQVTISQDYTEVAIATPAQFAVLGTYDGSKSTQYIVSVLRGGKIGTDNMVFTYRTNNGADSEGQVQVAASDFALVTTNDYPCGTLDMLLYLVKDTEWCTGDTFVFDVVGQAAGPMHTIVFQDAIPVDVGVAVDLDLFVTESLPMDEFYVTLAADSIGVAADAFITTDVTGTEKPLAVFGGVMFADYRELRTAAANVLGVTDGINSVTELLGPAVPENPLSLMTYKARENSGAVEVYYMPLQGTDLEAYDRALAVLTEYDMVYSLVVGTDDEDVKELVSAHVLERSNEDNLQWRIGWVGNPTTNIKGVYTETPSHGDILATVSEFSPGQYRGVYGASALFVTNGIRPADKLRINYGTDPVTGESTYDEYVIDRVVDENNLVLLTGLPAAVTVPVKIEIWRNLTTQEYAEELKNYPAKFGNRRMYSIYMDGLEWSNGDELPFYYLCAGLAGERSGMAPHAPMSQVSIAGFHGDPVHKFSRTQLNLIASGGNWIVVKDTILSLIYTRHQVSTAIALPAYANDLLQQEQQFTTNTDQISRDYHDATKDLFGQGNVSDDMLALIRQRLQSTTQEIRNRPYAAKLGPQIVDMTLTTLRIHPTNRDTVEAVLDISEPPPLNRLILRLKISAA